jgi:hypothetical protein
VTRTMRMVELVVKNLDRYGDGCTWIH